MQKGIWIATIFMVFLISIGTLVLFEIIPVSGEIIPEIDQNQVEDEVSKTIRINLEDGISSSNDIR